MAKSSDQTAKQERECAEFENFVRISGRSFDSFHSADEPEPDIVAFKGTDSFGIEITNFHRQAIKRRESEEDRVVELALSLYTESSGLNLYVDIAWAPHYEVRKRDRNELARKLVALIRQNIPQAGMVIHLDWRNFGLDLMAVISDVYRSHP